MFWVTIINKPQTSSFQFSTDILSCVPDTAGSKPVAILSSFCTTITSIVFVAQDAFSQNNNNNNFKKTYIFFLADRGGWQIKLRQEGRRGSNHIVTIKGSHKRL